MSVQHKGNDEYDLRASPNTLHPDSQCRSSLLFMLMSLLFRITVCFINESIV